MDNSVKMMRRWVSILVFSFFISLFASSIYAQEAELKEERNSVPVVEPIEPAQDTSLDGEDSAPADAKLDDSDAEMGIEEFAPNNGGMDSSDEDESTVQSGPIPQSSLFTGAATLSVPIIVPPGRADLAPNLSLNYNSYQKNGWIGLGWSLDLGSIQRSTKHGVSYADDEYVAMAGGSSSELVSRNDWGSNYYGSKIEGEFSKFYFNTATDGWEVTAKDGRKFFYGTTSASRQYNPYYTYNVFKWCLDRVEDVNGNYMTLSYTKDQGQIYLDRIDYTGNTAGLPTSNHVQFVLDTQARADAPPMYTTNFKVVTAKRLKSIEVYGNGQLARKYELTYEYSNNTEYSQVHSIVQYGSDGTTALPEVVYEYNPEASTLNSETSWGSQYYASATTQPAPGFADINGDGYDDFYYRRSGSYNIRVRFSTGDGFNTDQSWGTQTYASAASNPAPGFADLNGDGKADYYYRRSGTWELRVKLSTDYGYAPEKSWGRQRYGSANSNPTSGFADLNGDGNTDFWYRRSGTREIRARLSHGNGFESERSWGSYLYTNGSTEPVPGFADLNGDGKADFFYRKNGTRQLRVRPSLENGFDTEKTWGTYTYSCDNIKPAPGFADLNGDGMADFFYRKDNTKELRVMLSEGNTLASEKSWGTHIYTSAGSAPIPGFSDFNGDGKADFFYRWSGTRQVRVLLSNGDGFEPDTSWGMYTFTNGTDRPAPGFADINGDGKSDFIYRKNGSYELRVKDSDSDKNMLLCSVSNGMGGTSTLEYLPSSHYENDVLPMIVNTVSSITVNDGLGNVSTTEYDYSGGLYDYPDRDFRGFETAIHLNADGTTVKSTFHQDTYLKGRPEKVETWAVNKNPAIDDPYYRSTSTWVTVPANPPQGSWAFAKLSQQREDIFGTTPIFSQESFTFDDTNGNLLSSISSGSGVNETITKTNAYVNLGSWMWRISQEKLEGSQSGRVRQTDYTYYTTGAGKLGNLSHRTFWNNQGPDPVVEMDYDSYGNIISETDARDSTTTTEYDTATHTYPIRVTYPETNGVSHVMENETYDYRFGQVTRSKDENGNRTDYDYDVFGRLVQTDYPNGGQVISEFYDDVFPSYVVTLVKENASGPTIDAYKFLDGLGRTIQTVSLGEHNGSKYVVTKKYYDVMGRENRVEGPFFSTDNISGDMTPLSTDYPVTQTTYDDRGRPASMESWDSAYGVLTSSFAYDGLCTTITDPDSKQTKQKKDQLGRIIEVTEFGDVGAQYVTAYDYNAAGDLLMVTDAAGNISEMEYDSLGRKAGMIDPDMGIWSYTYDPNGNLLTQTDAKGQITTYAYDALNRITSKTYSTSDPDVAYLYDSVAIPNGKGRLYSITNGNVTTLCNAYDVMGNVTSVTKTITGDTARTFEFDYDLSGKPTNTRYPDGHEVVNTYYPGTGLLHTVSGPGSVVYAEQTLYEPTGKTGKVTHANGMETQYTYDPLSTRLMEIRTYDSNGNIQWRSYTYTPAGNINSITDHMTNISYAYDYDNLHRLLSETNTGTYDAVNLTYDGIGNITAKTVGSNTFTYAYDPLHKHAVKSITSGGNVYDFDYDANGNMTSGYDLADPASVGERTIQYNAENMPVNLTYTKPGNTKVTGYTYDGNGVRAKKAVSGGSTTYYINPQFEVIDGNVTKYIFAGNLRIAMITSSGIRYFHKDHLGSSTAMTDASGTVLETTEYAPFGSIRVQTGSNVSNYKYTDQEWDAESGLYNYNARLYDPVIGRFISADSIVPNFSDPQTLNRYSYCRNNPLIYTDPDGHTFGIATLLIKVVISGIKAELDGGDFWEGALIGAVTSAFSYAQGAGYFGSNSLVSSAIAGGLSGGAKAAIKGGSVGKGVLAGAVSAGINQYSSKYIDDDFFKKLIGKALVGGITGGVSAEIHGRSFKDGFVKGAKKAALKCAKKAAWEYFNEKYKNTKLIIKRNRISWIEFGVRRRSFTGPHSIGNLPEGTYTGNNHESTSENGMVCSDQDIGWSLDLKPEFTTENTNFQMHPNGNSEETEGTIGVSCTSSQRLNNHLKQYFEAGNSSIPVKVEH